MHKAAVEIGRQRQVKGTEHTEPHRQLIPREVFDTQEAAELMHVSAALLQLLRVKGGGPRFVKLSRRVLYRRSALEEWLKERERTSTSAEACTPGDRNA